MYGFAFPCVQTGSFPPQCIMMCEECAAYARAVGMCGCVCLWQTGY